MDWQAVLNFDLFRDALFKILLAAVLGGLVGFEREAHGQAAGFRTYILVAMGSCLMMMISLHMVTLHAHLDAQSVVRLDPGRIASYTLAGMGFLGAGAIIVGKGTVRGLTTAAGMWMITGVGLAVGCGYFIPAILVSVLSLFSLYVLRYTKKIFKRDIYSNLTLVSDDIGGQLDRIQAVVRKYPFSKIQFVNFRRRMDKEVIIFNISLMSKEDLEWRDLTRDLTALPGVREIALQEGKVS